MPGLFPINTVFAQGRRNQTVALDPVYGSQVTATLADSVTPALKGAAQYSFYPPGLLPDQEVWSRQLLVGTTAGSVKLSCDGGATWATTILDAGSSVGAVAIGEASTPQYPHAYAGLATGVLWSYTEAHDHVGTGTWTAIAPGTLSAITALTLPVGGYGACWVGCADGSLWRYTPSLGLFCVAQLPGAITTLCHLQDPSVVYGLCSHASLRLFMALEGGVEAAIFCLDKTQSYSALAAAGTRALLAAGASSILWSPDAGASWGTLPGPAAGPFTAAVPAPDDHNEVVALTAAGALSTSLDNGATWTARTTPGALAALEIDKHHPGVYYATGGGALFVSYDRGASWDTVLSSGVSALSSGALCCRQPACLPVCGGARFMDTIAGDGSTAIVTSPFPDTLSCVLGGWGMCDALALDEARSFLYAAIENVAAGGFGSSSVVYQIDLRTGAAVRYAGTGVTGATGDGGQAANAQLKAIEDMYVAANGDLFLADYYNGAVRTVAYATGIITTVAGQLGHNHFTNPSVAGPADGDGGAATTNCLSFPYAICPTHDGGILIADGNNYRIRKVDSGGTITTVAGDGRNAFSVGFHWGLAATAMSLTNDIACVREHPTTHDIYFSMWSSPFVGKIDAATGVISRLGGTLFNYTYAGDGGPVSAATFQQPTGLAFSSDGTLLYLADGNTVRVIDLGAGTITRLAGDPATSANTGDGGPAATATFNWSWGLVAASDDTLYLALDSEPRIKRICPPLYSIAVLDGADGSGVGDGFTLLNDRGGVMTPLVDHLFTHTGPRVWTNGLVWVLNPATGVPELWTVTNSLIHRWDARTITYIGTFPLPFSPNGLYQVSYMRNDGPAGRVWVSNGAGEAYRFNLDGTPQGGVVHFPNYGSSNYSARPIQVGNQIWAQAQTDPYTTTQSVVFRLDYTGARVAADLTGNSLTNQVGHTLVVGDEVWVYGWGGGPLSRWRFDGSVPGAPYDLSPSLDAHNPTIEPIGSRLLALYDAPGTGPNDGELYASDGTHYADVAAGSGVNDPLGVASYPPVMSAPALATPAGGGVSANPAVLSWGASAGATAHEVQVSLDGTFAALTVACATVTSPTYTTPALAGATTYSWRVRGLYDVHGGPWSAVRTFVTP